MLRVSWYGMDDTAIFELYANMLAARRRVVEVCGLASVEPENKTLTRKNFSPRQFLRKP
jgi:hypothetical protein